MGVELKSGQSQEPIEDGFSHKQKQGKRKSECSLPPDKKEKEIDSEEEVKYEELDDNVWDELERSFFTSRENSFILLCEKSMADKKLAAKENEGESFVEMVTKELERCQKEGINIEKKPQEEERRVLTLDSFEAPRPQEQPDSGIPTPNGDKDELMEAVIAKKRMSIEIDLNMAPQLSVVYSVTERDSVEPGHLV